MNTEIIDAGRDISGYKVDVSRGTNIDRVSSEWFSRPDDERYLSLDDLFASVKGRAERSRTRTVESAAIRVEANREDPENLGLVLPDADGPIAPTHWSFGQLSSIVGAPAAYHALNDPPETWPALLAKVTDLDGRLTGLHRTWPRSRMHLDRRQTEHYGRQTQTRQEGAIPE